MKSNFSNTVIFVLPNGTPAAALVVKEFDTATANLLVFDPDTGATTFVERVEAGYYDQTGVPGRFYSRPPVVPMGHPVWPVSSSSSSDSSSSSSDGQADLAADRRDVSMSESPSPWRPDVADPSSSSSSSASSYPTLAT